MQIITPVSEIPAREYHEQVQDWQGQGSLVSWFQLRFFRMKVLFLEIDTERHWAVASVGPAFIASFLRQHGHEARLLRVAPERTPQQILTEIQKEAPDLLALSLTTRQWLRAREVVGEIRRGVQIPVIAGGLHPTFVPESVLSAEGFDCVCLGEGEGAMLDLLDALEQGRRLEALQIPNIWVKGGVRPALRPPVQPLDTLPFMARDLLDEQVGVIHACTQRGCPFPCTYCAARVFQDLYQGTYNGRRRSVRNVLDELLAIRERGPLNYVIFLDDTFTVQKQWVREFCALCSREVGVGFSIHARIETVDAEMLKALAGAGCRHIVYGVESGSERVRRDIMKRPVENSRIIEVFQRTKAAGILATANYMFGLPGETAQDVEQTLALNEELQPNDFGYFVFYPYPGTRLFEVCRAGGYLAGDFLELPANHRQSNLRLPDLSSTEIDQFYERFTAAREQLYLKHYGAALDQSQRALVHSSFAENARQG